MGLVCGMAAIVHLACGEAESVTLAIARERGTAIPDDCR